MNNKFEYRTTVGDLAWDEAAMNVHHADDPVEPDDEDWELVGSVIGALRYSTQPILWFWRRKIE